MWARGGVGTVQCPRSVISGESVSYVEHYMAWRKLGGMKLEEMEARQAHAFLILERELVKIHGEQRR